ncbi:hypothetical protein H9639_15250 [Arthrobacter sp. Sa2CUA1]|uniref:Uncharacterized protein n=1 Tax=Arthrobacter gallicola TaxID=2762225 RepID=A0ABR8UVS5_9MICC|nr:hypothetical protein [Arthrobacter gallicola]MBD7996654.1 hypothetical protein [Arthrobacter gallicola]
MAIAAARPQAFVSGSVGRTTLRERLRIGVIRGKVAAIASEVLALKNFSMVYAEPAAVSFAFSSAAAALSTLAGSSAPQAVAPNSRPADSTIVLQIAAAAAIGALTGTFWSFFGSPYAQQNRWAMFSRPSLTSTLPRPEAWGGSHLWIEGQFTSQLNFRVTPTADLIVTCAVDAARFAAVGLLRQTSSAAVSEPPAWLLLTRDRCTP